jgi:hypothetical protein
MQTERDAPPVARYDDDFVEWLAAQSAAIREGRWADIDVENLTEEIDSLARSDKREIRSRLEVLLRHLLKRTYQPEKLTDSWLSTIDEQSSRIRLVIGDSPSLRRLLPEYLVEMYPEARKRAAKETHLAIDTFPETISPEFAREVVELIAPKPA